jgi:hypothetical protein
VLGFVRSSSLPNPQQAPVQLTQAQDALEIHKTSTGALHVVGFVRQSDTSIVMSGKPSLLAIAPKPASMFQTAVSIPIDRIRAVRPAGSQGQQWVELKMGDSAGR